MVDLSNNGEEPIGCEAYFVVIRQPDTGWTARADAKDILPRLMPARDADMFDFIHGCQQVIMDVQAHRAAQATTGMMAQLASQAAQAQQAASLAGQVVPGAGLSPADLEKIQSNLRNRGG